MNLKELILFAKMYGEIIADYSEDSYKVCNITSWDNNILVHILPTAFESKFADMEYEVVKVVQPDGKVYYEKRIVIEDVKFYTLVMNESLTKKDRIKLGLPGEDF